MTIDKEPLYDYGLTGLKSFLDNGLSKPSSLKRTISPKESSAFYVVALVIICFVYLQMQPLFLQASACQHLGFLLKYQSLQLPAHPFVLLAVFLAYGEQ
jgi:hypothetical protein